MNENAIDILARYEKAINKKRLLFKLQLSDLCVKADPMSLLSMKVALGDEFVNVEKAADVVKKDDETFILIPHEDCTLDSLVVAVTQAHPEFKQKYISARVAPDSDDTVMLLKLIMPEVDKLRHDVLVQGVDTLMSAINGSIDADKAYFSAKIARFMLEATPMEQDEVKQKFDEGAETCKGMVGEDAENKKKEIEEAYAEYLARQEEKKNKEGIQGVTDASGADVVNAMKME